MTTSSNNSHVSRAHTHISFQWISGQRRPEKMKKKLMRQQSFWTKQQTMTTVMAIKTKHSTALQRKRKEKDLLRAWKRKNPELQTTIDYSCCEWMVLFMLKNKLRQPKTLFIIISFSHSFIWFLSENISLFLRFFFFRCGSFWPEPRSSWRKRQIATQKPIINRFWWIWDSMF